MKRYDSLNGVRAIACFGIVFMHILANTSYNINSVLSDWIGKFTNFVFLFMILSAFSMCCGYYEKIKNNKVSVEKFYSRRIQKTLPFFAFLILIEVIFNHNKISLIEGFADITLLFGFIPKDLSVVGVGWFIGLIFIFYFIFPFFVYLFSNKKRAWITTVISLLMNLSCIYYFDIGRTNMFYSFLFFCIGGLLFLYKDNIIKIFNRNRIVSLLLLIVFTVCFFAPQKNKYILIAQIVLFSFVFISYAISFDKSMLNTKISAFIGNISLEIYLSHMLIFRILEKIKLINIISNDYVSYTIICIVVLIGTTILAKAFQLGWNIIDRLEHYRKEGSKK